MTTNISINIDVPQNYSVEELRVQLTEYAKHLISESQNLNIRKTKTDSGILKEIDALSGVLSENNTTDWRKKKSKYLEEKYK